MLSSKSMQMNTPLLSVNKLIFCSGGVLGRIDYILSLLKLGSYYLGGGLIVWLISAGLTQIHPAFGHLFTVYAVVGLILLLYFKYVNSFKRVRDIRGITLNEGFYKITYVILSIIPGLNFLVLLGLLLVPGEVTKETF